MGKHPLDERLIDAAFITGPRRKLVENLTMVVLRHHRPDPVYDVGDRAEVVGVRRWECAGHFGSNEEQHPWPCDEVVALAEALGVKTE